MVARSASDRNVPSLALRAAIGEIPLGFPVRKTSHFTVFPKKYDAVLSETKASSPDPNSADFSMRYGFTILSHNPMRFCDSREILHQVQPINRVRRELKQACASETRTKEQS
jgi:hypothetical protein